ncbi:O-antigen ligase family protein [Bdellovibrionota bacterium FG-1]
MKKGLTFAFALYAASTLISMAVMSIGAAILFAALVWECGGPRGLWQASVQTARGFWVRRFCGASGLLVAALALSLLGAVFWPVGWGGHFVQPEWWDLAKVWYFAWPILLVLGLRRLDEAERTTVLKTWIITFTVLSAIGIFQYFVGWPRSQPIPKNETHFHATLFLGHHLSVASIFIFPFFAVLDWVTQQWTARLRPARLKGLFPVWFLLLSLVLGFATLFLTYSRMLWLSLPLALLIWVIHALPRKQAVIAAALLVALGGGIAQLPSIQQRATAVMGIGDREKLWKANLEFLRLRPLTGTGFRRNIEASSYYLESLPNAGSVFTGHAHNNLIDMMGGTGILGALAWLLWCGLLFRIIGVSSRNSVGFSSGLLFAWIGFHLNGLTQVNFWEGKVMHQMMWSVAWILLWAESSKLREEVSS